jgi:hypothetical protein
MPPNDVSHSQHLARGSGDTVVRPSHEPEMLDKSLFIALRGMSERDKKHREGEQYL